LMWSCSRCRCARSFLRALRRPAQCSPRTNFGSSVERTAKLHPLWQACGSTKPASGGVGL
jgi:hypothetical protein